MSDVSVLVRQLQAVLKFLFGKTIAIGSTTVHWQAGQPISDTATVTHGLAAAPAVVLLTPLWTAFAAQDYIRCQARSLTSDTFAITAITGDGSNYGVATDRTVYWLAIG